MQRNRLSSFQFGALVKFVSRCRFGHTVASHVSLEDFVIRLMSIVSQEPALKKRKKLSTSRFPRWEKVIRKFASRCGSIALIDLLSFFYFEERKKNANFAIASWSSFLHGNANRVRFFFALFAHRDRCSLNVRSVTYTLPPPPPPLPAPSGCTSGHPRHGTRVPNRLHCRGGRGIEEEPIRHRWTNIKEVVPFFVDSSSVPR